MKNRYASHLVLAALWLMVFSISSQMMVISPILPNIADSLNISKTLQGSLITAYAIPLGILAFIIGPISDKIGRRRVLITGTGIMSITLFMHAFVYDYTSFLIIRMLTGAAGGLLSGASIAYVGDYFPAHKRGWANGIVMTGIAGGFSLGIPIGTLLAEFGSFRYPFVMFAVTMMIAAVLIWFYLPQPSIRNLNKKLTLTQIKNNYMSLFRRPELLALAASFALMSFCVAMYMIFLPTWLSDTFGLDGYGIAGLVFVAGFSGAIVSPFSGKLSDRLGRKVFVVNACMGLSIAIAMTTLFITDVWLAYPLVALAMMLDAARIGPFQALITELVPEETRGTMVSLSVTVGQLGMGFGGALAGFTYHEIGFVYNTTLAALAILLVGIIVAWVIPETYSKSDSDKMIPKEDQIGVLYERLPNRGVLVWEKKK